MGFAAVGARNGERRLPAGPDTQTFAGPVATNEKDGRPVARLASDGRFLMRPSEGVAYHLLSLDIGSFKAINRYTK